LVTDSSSAEAHAAYGMNPVIDRAAEAMKARARSAKRFGSAQAIATGHAHN